MANNLKTIFTDIADAIRSKNGTAVKYKPSAMPSAITALSGGGGGMTMNTTFGGLSELHAFNGMVSYEYTGVTFSGGAVAN